MSDDNPAMVADLNLEISAVAPLSLWRTLTPAAASSADADRLSTALVARARSARFTHTLPADVVARCDAGDPEAWLELADGMMTIIFAPDDGADASEALDIDLEASCIWMAARCGRRWAHVVLLNRLARLSTFHLTDKEASARLNLMADLTIMIDFAACIVPGARSLGILEQLGEYFAEVAARKQQRLERGKTVLVDDRNSDANGDHEEAEAIIVQGPSLRVLLAAPPPAVAREEKEVLKRFAVLAKPVRLAPSPDPAVVADQLLGEYPWLANVIDIVYRELSLSRAMGGNDAHLSPLLLAGPSGVGKSRFVRSLARALGVPMGALSAAGSSDNRTLAGTARGWSTAAPSYPMQLIEQHRVGNPLIMIDEVDKVAIEARNGRMTDTLLTLTESSTSKAWPDECLGVPCDLSRINWVMTANRLDLVEPLLRGRCRVVEVGRPRPKDFDILLRGTLVDLGAEMGGDVPELDEEVVEAMRSAFRRGNLQARQLGALVRRVLAAAATSSLTIH